MKDWSKHDWFTIITVIFGLAFILCLSGCAKSRTEAQTEKRDTVSVTGTITVPTADGARPIPVALTVTRRGTEELISETKSGADPQAIASAVGAMIAPLLNGASGGALGGIGELVKVITDAAMVGGIGYLAVAKRSQMKSITQPKGKP